MTTNLKRGDDALLSCEDGIDNTGIGNEALVNVEGSGNTALGERAGKLNAGGSPCLSAEDGVYLGKDVKASADDATNEIAIGSESEGGGSNTATLGNDSTTNTFLKGEVSCPKLAPTLMIAPKAEAAPVNAIVEVKAEGTITVSGTPEAAVVEEKADGTITVSGTPQADETFEVGGETYTFKVSPATAFQVGITADNTAQAVLIAAAITTDSTNCDATSAEAIVTAVAKTAGVAGNSLTLTQSATGLAVSGAGTLTGGVDAVAADTFVVGGETYTFSAAPSGAFELAIDADNTAQAVLIAAAITSDSANCDATNEAGVVTTVAKTAGTAGNALTLTQSATGLAVSGAGTITGGVDAVAGTPGYKGMITSYGDYLYMCNKDDYTTAQNGWLKHIPQYGAAKPLIISGGVIAITKVYNKITPEGGANDDLTNATGGTEGDLLILCTDGTFDVAVKDGSGAGAFITSGGATFTMNSVEDRIMFIHNGIEWVELSRSSNG